MIAKNIKAPPAMIPFLAVAESVPRLTIERESTVIIVDVGASLDIRDSHGDESEDNLMRRPVALKAVLGLRSMSKEETWLRWSLDTGGILISVYRQLHFTGEVKSVVQIRSDPEDAIAKGSNQ